MAPDQLDPGSASGHSVDEDPDGGFRWTAYGPGGILEGHAEARADAEAAAHSAEQELNEPKRSET